MKRIAKITGVLLLGALIGALSVFVHFDVALSSVLFATEHFLSANAYNNFMFVGVVIPVVMAVVSKIGINRYKKSIECESEYENDFLLCVAIAINSIDILLMLTLFSVLAAAVEIEGTFNMYYCLFSVHVCVCVGVFPFSFAFVCVSVLLCAFASIRERD